MLTSWLKGFNLKVLLIGMVAAAILGWVANGWRLNAKIDQLNLNHATALTKAFEASQAESVRMQREKDDAIAKAQEVARTNAAAASNARRERDRLRNQINTSTAYFAAATHATVVDYATTLTAVFEHCTAEYLNMAEKADGHALDAATLYHGWKGIAK
jgi:hypothetical protein